MADDTDPFETFSSETLRRAEEMCAGLSLNLSLDRRGQSKIFNGAVSDLDDPAGRHVSVTVAEVGDRPWFTLISDRPLAASRNALLVFRVPPGQDRKFIGRHAASEPGKRGSDDAKRQVVRFEIIRDVGKS
ncbi:hypothetical protein WM2015_2057 [Wenzhouxiangella marina]|uniref:Uncharacterized protein n=2 Tax=Wenzhouxiangella marina TaxID=1579979 RepID=A0A0K0XXR1_9GAMM|nr:hypothetical protein WM2015_2057 [Wenzhouxiangella marina]